MPERKIKTILKPVLIFLSGIFCLIYFHRHPRNRNRSCGKDDDAHAFMRPVRQREIDGAGFDVKQRGGAECIADDDRGKRGHAGQRRPPRVEFVITSQRAGQIKSRPEHLYSAARRVNQDRIAVPVQRRPNGRDREPIDLQHRRGEPGYDRPHRKTEVELKRRHNGERQQQQSPDSEMQSSAETHGADGGRDGGDGDRRARQGREEMIAQRVTEQ